MGAPDLLRHLIEAGLHLDAIGDRLSVTPSERITDYMRQAIREFKPALLALLAGNEKTLDPGLTDRELDRSKARLKHFARRGLTDPHADTLADELVFRDRELDDRRTCLECSHCTGAAPLAWRCGNHKAAGVGRELGTDLAKLLQRCAGFKEAVIGTSASTTHNRGTYP
ncbi:hypothetical protein ACVBEH_05015 [Roseateles sp. GG27B]